MVDFLLLMELLFKILKILIDFVKFQKKEICVTYYGQIQVQL